MFTPTRRGPGDGPRDFNRRMHFDFRFVFLLFVPLHHGRALFIYLFAEMPACQTEQSELARGNRGKNPTPFDIPFP